MGMIERALPERWQSRVVLYHLRLRYWYLDTESGRRAQLWGFAAALLVAIVQSCLMLLQLMYPPARIGPAHAIYPWVIQLIIAIISAVISYALRPKVEPPKPAEANTPTTEDGRAIPEVHGTCWIEDEFLLAWKIVGRDPIKTGGGKK